MPLVELGESVLVARRGERGEGFVGLVDGAVLGGHFQRFLRHR